MTLAGRGSILVVDEDSSCRQLIATAFQREGYSILEAENGGEALDAAVDRRPAAVLLEVTLPDISGYEVLRRLREQYGQELPIIFMSATRTEAFDRVAGLRLGADDYIAKPFAVDELLARVLRLHQRTALEADLGEGIASAKADQRKYGPLERLTARELEVLRMLADGLAAQTIAERLFISRTTVATHIQRILGKLGVHSRAEAVSLAYRHGIMPSDRTAHS